jgi:hypothetical protein
MNPNHPIKHKAVRIVSNGELRGTRIYLPNGTEISDLVNGVKWELGRDGIATASLQLVAATLEATPWPGEAEKQ